MDADGFVRLFDCRLPIFLFLKIRGLGRSPNTVDRITQVSIGDPPS